MSKLRVDSWKSIADYMKRGVRTVQRWHLDHGLPVYQVGGNKGSVYAYADELDRWLAEGAAGEGKRDSPDAVIEEQKRRSAEAERLASELWEVRSEENFQAMLGLYHSAIDQYPDNVAGIAGLANSLIFGGLIESLDMCLAYPSIKAAVNKALQKDPRHLKVQCAVAWANLLYEREWKLADRRFTEILRVNPAFGPALFGKALLNLACEDPVEATRFARACWSAEPMGACQGGLAAICMVYAGDMEGAARMAKQVELTGASCGMLAVAEAMVSIHTIHPDEALTIVESLTERHTRNDVLRGLLGYTLASAGHAERAEKVLESLYAKDHSPGSWYAKALVMSRLGRIREAVDTLKQRASVLSLWRFGHRTDRLLAPLHVNAEFQEMVAICFPNNSYHTGQGGRAA
jgi:tetratricopeptide (TPR) repeat protein